MEAIAIFPELIYPKNLTMREDTPGKHTPASHHTQNRLGKNSMV